VIPQVEVGIICGSSTNAINFPVDIRVPGVEMLGQELIFETPFGNSPEFGHFRYAGKNVLTCRMHGWRQGVTRAQASQQIFWVFKEAGVKYVLTEGGVGGINHLLETRDVVIPHDYLDFSMRKDVSLGLPYLLTMREPICPEVAKALYLSVQEHNPPRHVFPRSVYVCTDGRHFESPAEIQMFKQLGGDVIGQSVCPEVYLAREIGAHFASVQLVVNHAEGIVKEWQHQELSEIFYNEAEFSGQILLGAVAKLPDNLNCECESLRHGTMLRERRDGSAAEAQS